MDIFFERYLVGSTGTDADPAPVFRYEPGWLELPEAFPLSTTMPLRGEPFEWGVLSPWLLNLLPEDMDTLRVMARIHDVPYTDVLALLGKIGRDTSGALSFFEQGTTEGTVIPVDSEEGLEKIINDLPAKPFLAGEDGVSMSMAGAQHKLPVRLVDGGGIGIPVSGAASSHILKPDHPRFWGSVQNEAFCLTLARRLALHAATVTTGRAGEREYLLVERYDRKWQDGKLRRMHQEDFCQALGLPPDAKYQHSSDYSGPKGSFVQMMDRLREVGAGVGVAQLWRMLAFNVLVCNTDAHLKNHSVILTADGASLAPLYDVVCADVWESVNRSLALDVGGKRDGRHIEGRHWLREAKACGFAPRRALALVEDLARRMLGELDAVADEVEAMPAGSHSVIGQVREAVKRRCRTVLSHLG